MDDLFITAGPLKGMQGIIKGRGAGELKITAQVKNLRLVNPHVLYLVSTDAAGSRGFLSLPPAYYFFTFERKTFSDGRFEPVADRLFKSKHPLSLEAVRELQENGYSVTVMGGDTYVAVGGVLPFTARDTVAAVDPFVTVLHYTGGNLLYFPFLSVKDVELQPNSYGLYKISDVFRAYDPALQTVVTDKKPLPLGLFEVTVPKLFGKGLTFNLHNISRDSVQVSLAGKTAHRLIRVPRTIRRDGLALPNVEFLPLPAEADVFRGSFIPQVKILQQEGLKNQVYPLFREEEDAVYLFLGDPTPLYLEVVQLQEEVEIFFPPFVIDKRMLDEKGKIVAGSLRGLQVPAAPWGENYTVLKFNLPFILGNNTGLLAQQAKLRLLGVATPVRVELNTGRLVSGVFTDDIKTRAYLLEKRGGEADLVAAMEGSSLEDTPLPNIGALRVSPQNYQERGLLEEGEESPGGQTYITEKLPFNAPSTITYEAQPVRDNIALLLRNFLRALKMSSDKEERIISLALDYAQHPRYTADAVVAAALVFYHSEVRRQLLASRLGQKLPRDTFSFFLGEMNKSEGLRGLALEQQQVMVAVSARPQIARQKETVLGEGVLRARAAGGSKQKTRMAEKAAERTYARILELFAEGRQVLGVQKGSALNEKLLQVWEGVLAGKDGDEVLSTYSSADRRYLLPFLRYFLLESGKSTERLPNAGADRTSTLRGGIQALKMPAATAPLPSLVRDFVQQALKKGTTGRELIVLLQQQGFAARDLQAYVQTMSTAFDPVIVVRLLQFLGSILIYEEGASTNLSQLAETARAALQTELPLAHLRALLTFARVRGRPLTLNNLVLQHYRQRDYTERQEEEIWTLAPSPLAAPFYTQQEVDTVQEFAREKLRKTTGKGAHSDTYLLQKFLRFSTTRRLQEELVAARDDAVRALLLKKLEYLRGAYDPLPAEAAIFADVKYNLFGDEARLRDLFRALNMDFSYRYEHGDEELIYSDSEDRWVIQQEMAKKIQTLQENLERRYAAYTTPDARGTLRVSQILLPLDDMYAATYYILHNQPQVLAKVLNYTPQEVAQILAADYDPQDANLAATIAFLVEEGQKLGDEELAAWSLQVEATYPAMEPQLREDVLAYVAMTNTVARVKSKNVQIIADKNSIYTQQPLFPFVPRTVRREVLEELKAVLQPYIDRYGLPLPVRGGPPVDEEEETAREKERNKIFREFVKSGHSTRSEGKRVAPDSIFNYYRRLPAALKLQLYDYIDRQYRQPAFSGEKIELEENYLRAIYLKFSSQLPPVLAPHEQLLAAIELLMEPARKKGSFGGLHPVQRFQLLSHLKNFDFKAEIYKLVDSYFGVDREKVLQIVLQAYFHPATENFEWQEELVQLISALQGPVGGALRARYHTVLQTLIEMLAAEDVNGRRLFTQERLFSLYAPEVVIYYRVEHQLITVQELYLFLYRQYSFGFRAAQSVLKTGRSDPVPAPQDENASPEDRRVLENLRGGQHTFEEGSTKRQYVTYRIYSHYDLGSTQTHDGVTETLFQTFQTEEELQRAWPDYFRAYSAGRRANLFGIFNDRQVMNAILFMFTLNLEGYDLDDLPAEKVAGHKRGRIGKTPATAPSELEKEKREQLYHTILQSTSSGAKRRVRRRREVLEATPEEEVSEEEALESEEESEHAGDYGETQDLEDEGELEEGEYEGAEEDMRALQDE